MNKVSSVYYNDYVKFSTKEVTLPQYEFNDDSVNLKLYYHQESNPPGLVRLSNRELR